MYCHHHGDAGPIAVENSDDHKVLCKSIPLGSLVDKMDSGVNPDSSMKNGEFGNSESLCTPILYKTYEVCCVDSAY